MTEAKAKKKTEGGEASAKSLYDDITDRIIMELEAGRTPWVKPWRSDGSGLSVGMPCSAATGRNYSGINILLLWGAAIERGHVTQGWLTYRQARTLGGHIRKGERGSTIVYADRFVPAAERERARRDGDEPKSIPFLKRFTVFNLDQCEGLPEEISASVPPADMGLVLPQAEELIRATGADIRIGGDRAYYETVSDHVRLPPPQAFFEPVDWHRTALHELGHWTGARHRLKRDLSGSFGSKKYAFEELVAELTAAFGCASLGIEPTVCHADYLGSWLDVLREDNRAIVRAASLASKACDYLLGHIGAAGGKAAAGPSVEGETAGARDAA
jgi:antirestriction protein ArdC